MPSELSAIVDIGSNSVRLVVYAPPARAPAILFNEKVMAGLGASLPLTGALDPAAMAAALAALKRFALLVAAMNCRTVRVVATAAVRDASNGAAFLAEAAKTGFAIEVLSGDAEAEAAGLGVISAIPDADGIVGDLGGGSLELVRVRHGQVGGRLSLPLGVLRLAAIRERRGRLERMIAKALRKTDWADAAQGLPLYLVGGSWRALARVHMNLTGYPLRVLHAHVLPPAAAPRLVRALGQIGRKRLRAIEGVPPGRIDALSDAAALLALLARRLQSSALVVSAAGLREGLLYGALPQRERALDPLIVGVREAAARQVRFDQHGDLLAEWIAPLFAGEAAADARLRHAACLLGDVAWAANPDFRAERGVDFALHGAWLGIDARGRALIAQALHVSFGGSGDAPVVAALAEPEALARAGRWGLAMRLGQRLSGGIAAPLRSAVLSREPDAVRLAFSAATHDLYGEAVERRHRQLATALGVRALVS